MPEVITCACGQFHLELTGKPFTTAECHCTSCRKAAERFFKTTRVTAPNGGTQYALYRKDRVGFPDSLQGLRGHRLSEKAPTRRVVASCCNTPIFLEFQGGHWLSLYASMWPIEKRPVMQIRTQTGDAPADAELDNSLPAGGLTTAGFYAKLLTAWMAMGFKAPKLDIPEA